MAEQGELQGMLLARFAAAEGHRAPYDVLVDGWWRQYVGYREPREDGRSNIHVPRTYEEIDTLRARICKSLLGARPYIDFLPSGISREEVRANAEKAEVAAALVDMQLERNQFSLLLYKAVTSVLVSAHAVISVGWRMESDKVRRRLADPITGQTVEQEKTEKIWDDNELRVLDFHDFWWDPRGTDLDSCQYVWQRSLASQSELEARLELLRKVGAGKVYELDWERLRGASSALTSAVVGRQLAFGGNDSSGGYSMQDALSKEDALFEVLDYWTDRRHGILINRELAYYGDSPYWRHRKKPYAVASFDPTAGSFVGLCAAQIVEHLQEELNTTRNQRIDNVSLSINRMFRRDPNSNIDDTQLVWRPNGIIDAREGEFGVLPVSDVTRNAYQEEVILKTDLENALGVPPAQRGVSGTTSQTATEIVTQSSSAGIRFDVKIMLFESMGLKRLAYLMDCNNQQFVDEPRLIRMPGEEGVDAWREASPGSIVGEFDYRPAGSSVDPAANKELRRQQMLQLAPIIRDNPMVDQYEFTKMLLQSFDIKSPEKLMVPREQTVLTPGEDPAAAALALAGMGGAMTGRAAGDFPGNPGNPGGLAPPMPTPTLTGGA